MTRFGNDWWPAGVRRPRLRLVAALVASPLLVAAVATAIAFVVAGMTLPDGAQVAAQTTTVGLTALGALLAFTGSFGLVATLVLWALRRRSNLAFALAGALAGAAFLIVSNVVMTGLPTTPRQILGTAALGALVLLCVRWIAGVRRIDRAGPQ